MNIVNIFKTSGDVLQYAIPTVVGLQEVVPEIVGENYRIGAEKALKISTLIFIQRYGTMAMKRIFPKLRPDKSDYESFPSGHFMIGAQCAVRVWHRDGLKSSRFLLTLLGTICLGLGRYLPLKHDIIDLTVGGALGAGLGVCWNRWIP